jgi:hypothetical protein
MQLMRSRFRPPVPGAWSSAVDGESEPGGGALMGAVSANKLVGEAIGETWRKVKLGPLTRRVFTGWLAVTLGTSKVEPAQGDKRFTDPAGSDRHGGGLDGARPRLRRHARTHRPRPRRRRGFRPPASAAGLPHVPDRHRPGALQRHVTR